jgi:type I restriction enzyme, S subunit
MNSSIPHHWTQTTFGELNRYRSRVLDPQQFPDEKFELYSVPSFPNRTPELVSGSEIGSNKQVVEPNDVLVCKINPRINRVWLVGPKSQYRQIASSEWIIMRQPEADPNFLRYYFMSEHFRDLICADVTGVGGSLTRSQPKRVALFPIPLPPLPEQKRIADKLDVLLARVDACRARLDRVPAILKRFRQAVLAAAVSGRLTEEWRNRHTGAASEWHSTTFEAVCDEITVGYVGKMATEYRDSGIPFLRSLNVRPFRFDRRELKLISPAFHKVLAKSKLSPGDVVIVRSGAPGQCCVIPPELTEANCSDLVIVRPGPLLLPEFACIVVNSESSQSFVKTEQVGVAQLHFNVASMKKAPLDLPSLAEQHEIAYRVETLFACTDRLEERFTTARDQVEQLTPSLLSKAFRGEFRSRIAKQFR